MSTLPSDNLLPELSPVVIPPPTDVPGIADRPSSTAAVARVLHLINGEHYAGAERVQDLLAQCLPQYGFEVGIRMRKTKAIRRTPPIESTPLYKLPMRNRLDLGVAGKIAGIRRREQYSLIHAHTVRTALVGGLAARLAGVPMVYHVHSPASRDTTRPWLNYINRPRRAIQSAAGKPADCGFRKPQRAHDPARIRSIRL